jgi:2-(1,2-epoxy-1,2-dihydrophenyl)acetyl-CoA isomerase
MSELIKVELRAGYRIVALNRADKMNALTPELIADLIVALTEAEEDPDCRCVLLTGSGRAFCAGADLGGIAPDGDLGVAIETSWNPLARKLHRLAVPTVAAVNGVAAGAGANLALACDIVLAGHSASFVEVFCKLGLIPDTGGTYFLPRLAGTARAMGMALLGEKISAEQAADWGLIWKAVPDAELMVQARAMARHFAAAPTRGLAFTKHALHASAANTLTEQLALEARMMSELGRSADYREGVSAFLDKRAPRFEGR